MHLCYAYVFGRLCMRIYFRHICSTIKKYCSVLTPWWSSFPAHTNIYFLHIFNILPFFCRLLINFILSFRFVSYLFDSRVVFISCIGFVQCYFIFILFFILFFPFSLIYHYISLSFRTPHSLDSPFTHCIQVIEPNAPMSSNSFFSTLFFLDALLVFHWGVFVFNGQNQFLNYYQPIHHISFGLLIFHCKNKEQNRFSSIFINLRTILHTKEPFSNKINPNSWTGRFAKKFSFSFLIDIPFFLNPSF